MCVHLSSLHKDFLNTKFWTADNIQAVDESNHLDSIIITYERYKNDINRKLTPFKINFYMKKNCRISNSELAVRKIFLELYVGVESYRSTSV